MGVVETMARCKRFACRLFGQYGTNRSYLGLWVGALVLLWTLSVHSAGLPPADPHINAWEWNDHSPPVGWFIVDFIIFVFLLVKFTKKPLQSTFENRHATIKRSISEAAERFDKAQTLHRSFQAKLANVEQEAADLIASGKADGTTEKNRLLQEAQDSVGKMKGDSSRLLDQESVRARARLQAQTVLKALNQAERVLEQQLNAEDQSRLIEQAIADLENQPVVGGAA